MRRKLYWSLGNSWIWSRRRWMITLGDEYDASRVAWPCRRGRRLRPEQWPDPPPLLQYTSAPKFEDVPFATHMMFVVSARMREFLELHTKRALQFLPVRIRGPRAARIPGPYWQFNVLRRIKCLHEMSYNEDKDGCFVQFPVLDASKVPDNCDLFVPADWEMSIHVSDRLKLLLEEQEFSGLTIERVSHSDGTNLVKFVKPKR